MLERLLGSQIRAAILRVLFTKEQREVHIRELARMTGFSAPCLMREIKMLASESLIGIDKRENRSYCRANERSPFYPVLCELVDKAESGDLILAHCFAQSEVAVVFIYGSRAKGTARNDSDYDLFVIGEIGLRQVSALVGPARERLGVEINPYVITPSELKKRLAQKDHFLTEVLNGKKIFVKGGEDELRAMAG